MEWEGVAYPPTLGYTGFTVNKDLGIQMQTFDDISCEEYYNVYEELAELQAWMAAHEADTVAAEAA